MTYMNGDVACKTKVGGQDRSDCPSILNHLLKSGC